jgi:hypothetical protein
MSLLRRQTTFTLVVYDDQSKVLYDSYSGNWTRATYGNKIFYNDTITETPNPGASFSLSFQGSQAWIYGGVLNNSNPDGTTFLGFPTASYMIDGYPSGSQTPYYQGNELVYFATPQLADGLHTINVTVTTANITNLYIFDYFAFTPTAGAYSSGLMTTSTLPTSTMVMPITTTHATPVGAIVGGVVGGIAGIAILAILAYYFMNKRSRGGRAYYFEKPNAADVLAGEDRIEPFDPSAATPASPPPSSTGFTRPGPQSAYSDGSSNQPLNRQTFVSTQSGPSDAGLTFVSGTSTAPRTGKAALIAQQYDEPEPVQFQDSGIRFNEPAGQGAGPSQMPSEVPPTYTPN